MTWCRQRELLLLVGAENLFLFRRRVVGGVDGVGFGVKGFQISRRLFLLVGLRLGRSRSRREIKQVENLQRLDFEQGRKPARDETENLVGHLASARNRLNRAVFERRYRLAHRAAGGAFLMLRDFFGCPLLPVERSTILDRREELIPYRLRVLEAGAHGDDAWQLGRG